MEFCYYYDTLDKKYKIQIQTVDSSIMYYIEFDDDSNIIRCKYCHSNGVKEFADRISLINILTGQFKFIEYNNGWRLASYGNKIYIVPKEILDKDKKDYSTEYWREYLKNGNEVPWRGDNGYNSYMTYMDYLMRN